LISLNVSNNQLQPPMPEGLRRRGLTIFDSNCFKREETELDDSKNRNQHLNHLGAIIDESELKISQDQVETLQRQLDQSESQTKELRQQLETSRQELIMKEQELESFRQELFLKEQRFQLELVTKKELIVKEQSFQQELVMKEQEVATVWLIQIIQTINNSNKEIPGLRIAELSDFILEEVKFSSTGCNGCVKGVKINWEKIQQRVKLTQCESLPEYIAVKMLWNYSDQQNTQSGTLVQKDKFDREYYFPLGHPHWSIIQVHNYFRSNTLHDYLPSPEMIEFCSNRTTFFTMECGQGNLETFIENNPNINNHQKGLILFQLLVGVSHLQSCEFAHMDLKVDCSPSSKKIHSRRFVHFG